MCSSYSGKVVAAGIISKPSVITHVNADVVV
jgi:hypothetical protein